MQSVEVLARTLEAVPEALRRAREEVLEDLGRDLLASVRGRIGGGGRVAGVQRVRIGSGGGYVAVSARAGASLGGYAAGYVTNALENGHEQKPGRFVPGLVPAGGGHGGKGARLRSVYVSGKHMYLETREEAAALAEAGARALDEAIRRAAEGGGV